MEHFADRLTDTIAERGPLCVGFDPYPARIPALFGAPGPAALEAFFSACIAALAGRVAAIKPQIALFEAGGPEALAVLARLTFQAREAGLLVILDAKRGDIGATAQGYVDAYLGPNAWLHADAVTVNPYMGLDTLEPWQATFDHGKGVFVLVRTSNPDAQDFQSVHDQDGTPLYARVAAALSPAARASCGTRGWSALGVVVGATAPDEARQVRRLVPEAPFLVPGFGAQGASAAQALAGTRAGAGVIVNASRAVLYPPGCAAAGDLATWRAGFIAGVETAQAELRAEAGG